MSVLVINSGSSSLKYKLLEPASGQEYASGLVEKIGDTEGIITHIVDDNKTVLTFPIADHSQALEQALRLFDTHGPDLHAQGKQAIQAVGHRIVQGGMYFSEPTIIDDEVEQHIEELIPLAPLHNPAHLAGIRVARQLLPDIPHVAVFDTAFFHSLPKASYTYAIDRNIAAKYQIRRYGAHGTSHAYVSDKVARFLRNDQLKQIVLHIGNGASASAVINGKAVETSMGLTPLESLVMGTRCGDIDPTVVFHLYREAGMSIDEIDDLFNRGSGLKALAGDNDMRAIKERMDHGDEIAHDAVDVYVHRIAKYIGSYTAIMGGLDTITFTAGIGENSDVVRSLVINKLAPFGVFLDEKKNKEPSKEARIISRDDSSVKVLVVPTNEELSIARQSIKAIN